ncbi:hypothetical protein D3C74_250660 [compost metagenome]
MSPSISSSSFAKAMQFAAEYITAKSPIVPFNIRATFKSDLSPPLEFPLVFELQTVKHVNAKKVTNR